MADKNLKFEFTALDKTQQAFASINKSLGRLTGSFGKFQVIVTAAFGALASSKVIAISEELSKLSSKTGLTVERLSNLKYVAEQSDTSLETLAKSIAKMQKNLVEASGGAKTAVEAFRQIGIDFKTIKDLSPDSQLTVIAAAFSNIVDPAQRTAAAMALFGKSGADLLPFLENGAEGVKKLQEEAKKLGTTFSSEAAGNIKEMNDAVGSLISVFDSFAQRVIGFVAPAITAAINTVRDLLIAFGKIIDGTFKGVAYVILAAFEAIIRGTGNLMQAAADIGLPFANAATSVKAYAEGMRELKESFSNTSSKAAGLGNEVEKTNSALKAIKPPSFLKDDAFKNKAKDVKEFSDALTKLAAQTQATYGDVRDFAASGLNGLHDQLVDTIIGTESLGDSFKNLAKTIEKAFVDIVTKQTITAPLANIIDQILGAKSESASKSSFGGIGDLFSGLFSGGGLGDIFGGFFADGGNMPANKISMVGERGPELVIPSRNSTVIPNNALGGVTVHQTIQISTGVQQTVRAEIASMMPQIAASSKAAVADAVRRGGSYSRAFA